MNTRCISLAMVLAICASATAQGPIQTLEAMIATYESQITGQQMTISQYVEWLEDFDQPIANARLVAEAIGDEHGLAVVHRARFHQLTLANVTERYDRSHAILNEFIESSTTPKGRARWQFSLGEVEWQRFVQTRDLAFVENAREAITAGLDELDQLDNEWTESDVGLLVQSIHARNRLAGLLSDEAGDKAKAIQLLIEAESTITTVETLAEGMNPGLSDGLRESVLGSKLRIAASLGESELTDATLHQLAEITLRQSIGYYVVEAAREASPTGGALYRKRIMDWIDSVDAVDARCNMLFTVANDYAAHEENLELIEHLGRIVDTCIESEQLPPPVALGYEREVRWLAMLANSRLGNNQQVVENGNRFLELADADEPRNAHVKALLESIE